LLSMTSVDQVQEYSFELALDPRNFKNFGDLPYLSIHELLPVAKLGRTTVNGKIFGAAFIHEESLNDVVSHLSTAVSETLHVLSVIIF